jgi:DNA-binding HxlR family transcriptional regulator
MRNLKLEIHANVFRGAVVNEVTRIECNGMDSAVRQIGDSWSLLIVWAALQGTTRFDNFQSRLGVARNILSNRLSKLVDEGILCKRPVQSGARRLEYRVTGKGEALRPALEMIEGWGNNASINRLHH